MPTRNLLSAIRHSDVIGVLGALEAGEKCNSLALELAAECGNIGVVRVLLKNTSANVSKSGAIELAEDNDYFEIAELLRKARKKVKKRKL